jgi:hypothetical protein
MESRIIVIRINIVKLESNTVGASYNRAVDLKNLVGFEVLTAARMKMAVFWVVVPCSLVEVYQRVRGNALVALMVEAASTSETLLNFYQTSPRYNPEDSLFSET